MITALDAAERKVCKFLYCAQVYRKYIELAFKKHEEIYKGLTFYEFNFFFFLGLYSLQDNVDVVSAFAAMFRNIDTICTKFYKTFQK